MKKTKYIRFLFGLGIFGMVGLFIAIAPVQSWGVDICASFTCPAPGQFNSDTSIDSDGDGFRDKFECCATSNTYYDENNTPIPPGLFDVNVPDLYVVVTKSEDFQDFVAAGIDIDNVLEYISPQSIGIRVHEIEESLVGGVREEDRFLPDGSPNPAFRRVSPGSHQRVVRLHLSGYTEDPECPIDPDIKIGIGNVGTTMHPNAGGTSYIRQIKRKVECLYQLVYGFDFWLENPPADGTPERAIWDDYNGKAREEIEKYIKHTAAHEIFHNLHLKYYNLQEGADLRAYNKYEDHYADKVVTIMAQRVRATAKGSVELFIGTTFEPEDAGDALDNMTELVDAPL